jgi:exosortase B
MSTNLSIIGVESASARASKMSAWLLILGFVALYATGYFGLAKTTWTDSEEMHGPVVLAVALWALYQMRVKLFEAMQNSASLMAWPVLILGLGCFLIGKMLGIIVLEMGSQLFVFCGCLLLLGGTKAVKLALFPLVFLIFLVPLPGNLIDSLTGSLKQVVSIVAEDLLYWAGYPVARSGVTITIGQYQLLVADACSGLKSMFSLSAIGFLYLYLVEHKSRARNLLLVLSFLPIAFVANITRVMTLILVTYHFGDAAGQGFVHDFAGLILFVFAVLLLSGFDALLGICFVRSVKPSKPFNPPASL